MQWMACGWYRLKIAPEPEQKQPRKDRKVTSLENNKISYFSICLNCFGGLVYCSSASSVGASFQPWCFLHCLLHWPHFGMGYASRYQPHIQTSVHDLCLPTKMLMFGGNIWPDLKNHVENKWVLFGVKIDRISIPHPHIIHTLW